jgi:hypothetical protein
MIHQNAETFLKYITYINVFAKTYNDHVYLIKSPHSWQYITGNCVVNYVIASNPVVNYVIADNPIVNYDIADN